MTDLALLHPTTGELLDLSSMPTTQLAELVDSADEARTRLFSFRDVIVSEIASRLDRDNSRSATVGDWTLTTNAPTSETWDIDGLRGALNDLAAEGVITGDVADRVIVVPPPKEQEARVARRELSKLLRIPGVGDRLSGFCESVANRRTLRVERVRHDAA